MEHGVRRHVSSRTRQTLTGLRTSTPLLNMHSLQSTDVLARIGARQQFAGRDWIEPSFFMLGFLWTRNGELWSSL